MRKKAKRSLAVLLTLVMLITMFPTTAFGHDPFTGQPYDSDIDSQSVVLSIYTGGDGTSFPSEPSVHSSGYKKVLSEHIQGNGDYADTAKDLIKYEVLEKMVQGPLQWMLFAPVRAWAYFNAGGVNEYLGTEADFIDQENEEKIIESFKTELMVQYSIEEEDFNVDDFKIVWYVIKYQTSDSKWHIDGMITKKSTTDEKFYTVSYFGNGNTAGTAPEGTANIISGTEYTVLDQNDLEKEVDGSDADFLGWSDGTNVYQPGDKITVDKDYSLSAVWDVPVTHTGQINVNLNDTPTDISTILDDSSIEIFLSRDGVEKIALTHSGTGVYTATISATGSYGLYMDDGGSISRIGNNSLVVSGGSGSSMDVDYYSVSYNTAGGDFDPGDDPGTVRYLKGEQIDAVSEVPVYDGYTFAGWTDGTVVDGNLKIYPSGSTVTNSISSPISLTAVWESSVGVTVNVSIDHTYTGLGGEEGYDKVATKDELTVELWEKIGSGAPVNTGKKIDFSDAGVTDYTYTPIKNGVGDTIESIYTYTGSTGSFTGLSAASDFSVAASKSGYDTSITSSKDSNGNWTFDVELKYNPQNFDLSFDVKMDGGVDPVNYPQSVNVKVMFWADDRDAWEVITQQASDSDPGVEVEIDPATGEGTGSYPVWKNESDGTTPYDYRIIITSFKDGSGNVTPASAVAGKELLSYSDGNYTADITTPDGRTSGEGLPGAYYDGSDQIGTPTATIGLETYSVTFHGNGGTLDDGLGNSVSDLTLSDLLVLPDIDLYEPVKADYIFGGWYKDSGLVNKAVNNGAYLTSDVDLYAKWIPVQNITGEIKVMGTYEQDGHDVQVYEVDRAKEVTVILQDGYGNSLATKEETVTWINRDPSDPASAMDGYVSYSFTDLDGSKDYRVKVQVGNYTPLYQNENTAAGTYNSTDYTAEFDMDPLNTFVNVRMDFEPDSYDQKIVIDATDLGAAYQPTSVLGEVHYRIAGDSGLYKRISQHNVAPYGVNITLSAGEGAGSESIWKYLYSGVRYDYILRLSNIYGDVTGVKDGAAVTVFDPAGTYDEANAPYQITYTPAYTYWNGSATSSLKATITANTYKVNFDLNLGGSLDTITGMDAYLVSGGKYAAAHKWSYDTSITAEPERDGYIFTGWTCDTPNTYDGSKVLAAVYGDVTLKANWEEDVNGDGVADYNQKKVNFKVVNGKWSDDSTVKTEYVTLYKGGIIDPTGEGEVTLPTDMSANSGYDAGDWQSGLTISGGKITVSGVSEETYTYTFQPRADMSYTVKYLKQSTSEELKAEKNVTGQTFGASVTENAVDIPGYNKVDPATKTIEIGTGTNEIVFYYTPKNDITLTVYHRDTDTDALLGTTYSNNMKMDEYINIGLLADSFTGYTYGGASDPKNPTSYKIKADNNEITLYYSLNEYDYKVMYYYDGVYDSSKDETGSAKYGSSIDTYTDKNITDCVLDYVTGLPLTIGTDESLNVIKVYYATDVLDKTPGDSIPDGVPDWRQAKVTFHVYNGTWQDDHTKTDKIRIYDLWSKDGSGNWTLITPAPTLGALPAADPDAGWETGSWLAGITADTAVTGNAEYTYSYTKLKEYDISATVENGTVKEGSVDFTVKNVSYSDSDTTTLKFAPKSDGNNYVLESLTVVCDGAAVPGAVLNSDGTYTVDHMHNWTVKAVYAVDNYGTDTDSDGVPDEPDGIADWRQAKVTFHVHNGTWQDDGTKADKIRVYNLWSKDGSGNWTMITPAPKLGALPAADPDTGWTTGSWLAGITADSTVTGNAEYTYAYTKLNEYNITATAENGTAKEGSTDFTAKTVTHSDSDTTTLKFAPKSDGNNYVLESFTVVKNGTPVADQTLDINGEYTVDHKHNWTVKAVYAVDNYGTDTDSDGVPDEPDGIADWRQAKVTFHVHNGTWQDDGTKADKIRVYNLWSKDGSGNWTMITPAPKLGALPAADPDTGWTTGSWLAGITADTAVAGNAEYIYSYTQLKQYGITATAENGTVKEGSVDFTAKTVTHSDSDTTTLTFAPKADGNNYVLESLNVVCNGAAVPGAVLNSDGTYTVDHKNHWTVKAVYAVDNYGKANDPDGIPNDPDGIPDKYQKKITFHVTNGMWSDDSTADKEYYVTLKNSGGKYDIGGTADISGIIPAGMKPDEANGYTGTGAWSANMPAGNTVSGVIPETYTYKFDEKKKYTLSISTVNGSSNPASAVDPNIVHDAGETTEINFWPATNGYMLESVTIDGVSQDISTYSDSFKYDYTHTKNLTIAVVYTKDELGNGDSDGKGDRIPDKYQRTVKFDVINGSWSSDPADTAQKSALVTLSSGGVWSETGTGEVDLPTGMKAFSGYNQSSGAWNEASLNSDPDGKIEVTANAEYKYSFVKSVITNEYVYYEVHHNLQQPDGSYQTDTSRTEYKIFNVTKTDGVITSDISTPLVALHSTIPHYVTNASHADSVSSVVPQESGGTVTVADLELYYDLDKHTVEYDLNGGSLGYGLAADYYDDEDIRCQTQYAVKQAPVRLGYNFLGWNDGTKDYKTGDKIIITEDVSLKAEWEAQKIGYTVRYLTESAPHTPIKAELVSNADYASAVNIADITKPDIDGYTYTGANVSSITIALNPALNVIDLYYAVDKWDEADNNTSDGDGTPDYKQAVIKFKSDDNGAVSGDTVQVFNLAEVGGVYKETVTPAAVTSTGNSNYIFDYWTLNGGTEKVDPFVSQEIKGNNEYVYTAHFTKDAAGPGGTPDGVPDYKQAVVKFEAAANGTVTGDLVQVFDLAEVGGVYKGTVTPVEVTPEGDPGYSFSGWYLGEGTEKVEPFTAQEVEGNKEYVYKAVFKAKSSKKPVVVLTKVDADDKDTVLEDVVFDLYKEDGTLKGTYTTGADGKIKLYALQSGNYYWKEKRPAEGYMLDTSKHEFSVEGGTAVEMTITNTRGEIPEVFSGDHYAYIIGYEDGRVYPENNITRAEVATIFFRLLNEDVRSANLTKSNSFADVDGSMWFNTAVSTMANMGVINGYPDGNFYPDETITRAEFAAIAARFDENVGNTDVAFSDLYDHWAEDEVGSAANNGWILGYDDNTFKPDKRITRAEAMTMINRVLQRIPENTGDLLENMAHWKDNQDPSMWYYIAVQEATNTHDYERKDNGYEKWTVIRENPDWSVLE